MWVLGNGFLRKCVPHPRNHAGGGPDPPGGVAAFASGFGILGSGLLTPGFFCLPAFHEGSLKQTEVIWGFRQAIGKTNMKSEKNRDLDRRPPWGDGSM